MRYLQLVSIICIVAVCGCIQQSAQSNETQTNTVRHIIATNYEAQAIALADDVPQVREFLRLYPNANVSTFMVGGCELSSELSGKLLECSPEIDGRGGLLVVYWAGEHWSGVGTQAVKVGFSPDNLSIVGIYSPS